MDAASDITVVKAQNTTLAATIQQSHSRASSAFMLQ
jgi:hypothetical protein